MSVSRSSGGGEPSDKTNSGISADGGHGSNAIPRRPLKAKERTAFLQEYDRRRTIPRAATWSMADGLAEPQWFNLAKNNQ